MQRKEINLLSSSKRTKINERYIIITMRGNRISYSHRPLVASRVAIIHAECNGKKKEVNFFMNICGCQNRKNNIVNF